MEITAGEIAILSVMETEQGWIRSRNGNYRLEYEDGNLSVCYRDGLGWGWNYYEKDILGSVPKFPRFQGSYDSPLAAMLAARLWYEDNQRTE